MAELYFEDFVPGEAMPPAACVVSQEEALAFARDFDPQPCHLDQAEGEASLLGGLSVSGWHTAALGMRLIYDAFLARTASLGSPGIESMRWRRPVHPGDRLTLASRVVETRRSRSKPGVGLVSFDFTLLNQNDECVMTQTNVVMVGCRPAGAAP